MMNFAQTLEAAGDNTMFQILIFFHSFQLFEKSYRIQIEKGHIAKAPESIQIRLKELYDWWVIRKREEKSLFLEDQSKLIDLIKLREYI